MGEIIFSDNGNQTKYEDVPANVFTAVKQLMDTYSDVKKQEISEHWIIDDEDNFAGYRRIWRCHCPICKKDPQDDIGGSENWWLVRLPNYCPNCGYQMIRSEG